MAAAALLSSHVMVLSSTKKVQYLIIIHSSHSIFFSNLTTLKPKMAQPLTHKARSAYRALLRELPRKHISTPTPLHQRLRAVFRSQEHSPSTTEYTQPSPSTATSSVAFGSSSTPLAFSPPSSEEERLLRVQEAEQVAQYARSQRTYAALLERYNPGMHLDEEERIRLTARRVGLDLPELHNAEGREGKGSKSE